MVEGGGAVVDWGGVRCFAAAPVSDNGCIVASGDGRAPGADAGGRRAGCCAAEVGGAGAGAAKGAGAASSAAEGGASVEAMAGVDGDAAA